MAFNPFDGLLGGQPFGIHVGGQNEEAAREKQKMRNLLKAIQSNNLCGMAEILLGCQQVDLTRQFVDVCWATPLFVAVKSGHLDSVDLLLKCQAETDFDDGTLNPSPLMLSASAGNEDIAVAMLASGAQVDWITTKHRTTALYCTVWEGQVDMARMLLDAGGASGAVQTRTPNLPHTPLVLACRTGHSKLVELLLDSNANPNGEGNEIETNHLTPLVAACEPPDDANSSEFLKTIEILISRNADVNQRATQWGVTPLCVASKCGFSDAVSLLLGHGADVHQPIPGSQLTALQVACMRSHVQVVKLLLRYGANVYMRNGMGERLIDLKFAEKVSAVLRGHEQVVSQAYRQRLETWGCVARLELGDLPSDIAKSAAEWVAPFWN